MEKEQDWSYNRTIPLPGRLSSACLQKQTLLRLMEGLKETKEPYIWRYGEGIHMGLLK